MRKSVILAAAAFGLLATSCEHKELCLDHDHSLKAVNVIFDWRNAPAEFEARHMNLWCFPDDGGEPVRFQLPGKDGGYISILPGRYHLICLDGNHENIVYSNTETFEGFELSSTFTRLLAPLGRSEDARVPRAPGTDEYPVMAPPDPVYGHAVMNFNVPENESATVTMYPEDYTCRYEVYVHDVKNMDNAYSFSGSLSGIVPSVRAASREYTGVPSLVPFEISEEDDTTLVGRFLTFGHCPVDVDCHTVVIYALMRDGKQRYQVYGDDEDKTVHTQIHNAPDHRNVRIDLYGLDLPLEPSGGGGGGLTPDVSDWGNVNFDVEM